MVSEESRRNDRPGEEEDWFREPENPMGSRIPPGKEEEEKRQSAVGTGYRQDLTWTRGRECPRLPDQRAEIQAADWQEEKEVDKSGHCPETRAIPRRRRDRNEDGQGRCARDGHCRFPAEQLLEADGARQ